MNINEIFYRAEWWPVFLSIPAYLLISYALHRRRSRALDEMIQPGRQAKICADLSAGRRKVRIAFAAGALTLGSVALLDPVWGEEKVSVQERGIDILICLDVSKSMLARDLPPSRLDRAKRDITALAEHARGDRLGCVAFAGDAKLSIPLTLDRDTFVGLLEPLDPKSIARGGTDLGRAVDAALAALESGSENGKLGNHEVILLLTDGEDLAAQGLAAAKRAADRGVTIHCVGFGDTRGSKITINEEGTESFLKTGEGAEVVSALDADALRKIATETGGEFIRADALSIPLVELYERRIVPKAKKTFDAALRRDKSHRFQWPLLGAVLLCLLDLGLSERKKLRTAGI
ncbi:MAG: vWA domain-containing protein [Planctomycetota bacterium]